MGRRVLTHYALSLGAGVNSTALLHVLLDAKMPLDEVVFADTGAEKPETYQYLEKQIVPFLTQTGIPYTKVVSTRRYKIGDMVVREPKTLLERCETGRAIPDRRYRWSTRDYKITPLYQHLKPKAPVVCYLGIAYDEIKRMKQENAVDWLKREWPLIDRRLSRPDCIRIIESKGWPVPPKSGCWFCPFSSIADWRTLYRDHPDLWERAIMLEKNGSKYPEFTLIKGGLAKLGQRFSREDAVLGQAAPLLQKGLDDFQDECEGACFT